MATSTTPAEAPPRALALLRLCQLVSPALPVGAFHFSQGLEYAVEAGWVHDKSSAGAWIGGIAGNAVATLDLPVLRRLQQAWGENDSSSALRWSRRLLAARETDELRAEDRHLGGALARILVDLDTEGAQRWLRSQDASFAALFALAASRWQIDAATAAHGYLWSWCETQVLAVVKLVPLGQSAGQRLLDRLIDGIPSIVVQAHLLGDEDIGVASPRQGVASALHETQYSPLFRS